MAAVRYVVVLVSPASPAREALAETLRDSCVVRRAESAAAVPDRLDEAVDVVLVDPAVGDDAVAAVREAVADRDVACRVGTIQDPARADAAGDGGVVPAVRPGRAVRQRVEVLGLQARYCRTLDRYYDLVAAQAGARSPGAATGATEAELRARLDRLG